MQCSLKPLNRSIFWISSYLLCFVISVLGFAALANADAAFVDDLGVEHEIMLYDLTGQPLPWIPGVPDADMQAWLNESSSEAIGCFEDEISPITKESPNCRITKPYMHHMACWRWSAYVETSNVLMTEYIADLEAELAEAQKKTLVIQ